MILQQVLNICIAAALLSPASLPLVSGWPIGPQNNGTAPDVTIQIERNVRGADTGFDDIVQNALHAVQKLVRNQERIKAKTGAYSVGINASAVDAWNEKYNGATQPNKRDSPVGTGSVPLTTTTDKLVWYGPQDFGIPGQTVARMFFDTGSPDLVLSPHKYDPTKSKSARDTGKTFHISYLGGQTATGPIYADAVTTAGLTVKGQKFGLPKEDWLPVDFGDGIAGMSFQDPPQNDQDDDMKPFFYGLVEQQVVKEDIFAFGLQPTGGRLDLGGLSPSAYKGDIYWADVDPSSGGWWIPASINGHEIASALIDSGTTSIVSSRITITEICKRFGGEMKDIDPEGDQSLCTIQGKEAKVIINVARKDWLLSQESIILPETDGDPKLTYLGLMALEPFPAPDAAIFGEVFLNNVYAVFNGTTGPSPKLGFAAPTYEPSS